MSNKRDFYTPFDFDTNPLFADLSLTEKAILQYIWRKSTQCDPWGYLPEKYISREHLEKEAGLSCRKCSGFIPGHLMVLFERGFLTDAEYGFIYVWSPKQITSGQVTVRSRNRVLLDEYEECLNDIPWLENHLSFLKSKVDDN